MLISHMHIFFTTVSVQIFEPFIKLCYLLLLFWELFLHKLNKSFIQYTLSKHFLWFAFIPLTVIFKYQNFWILMTTNLSISSFTGHAFSIVPKKSWPNPTPQRFSPTFSSTSFISTSNIPLRQYKVYSTKYGSKFIFCLWIFNYSSTMCNYISPLNHFCTLVKNQLTIYVWVYFWTPPPEPTDQWF